MARKMPGKTYSPNWGGSGRGAGRKVQGVSATFKFDKPVLCVQRDTGGNALAEFTVTVLAVEDGQALRFLLPDNTTLELYREVPEQVPEENKDEQAQDS